MHINNIHTWDIPPEQARHIQEQYRQYVIQVDSFESIKIIAGVDVGIVHKDNKVRAAAVLLTYPDLKQIEIRTAISNATFPYIPGLLSFREIPVLLLALEQLTYEPDIIIVDGQGIAHPRRFGLASHLGVLCNKPTIGVAKTRLIGNYQPVPDETGMWQPLIDQNEMIGAVLRTRQGVKPIFVSVGHRISLHSAIQVITSCVKNYRLPEPTRIAHQYASKISEDVL